MAIYRYKAFDKKAKNIVGVIQAESKVEAIGKVKDLGLVLTDLKIDGTKKGRCRLNNEGLLLFCQDMSILLKARIPLFQALVLCQKRYRHTKSNPLFVYLVDGVKNGQPLSSLFENFPQIFDAVFITSIRAAESSSRLDKSFESLYAFISFRQSLKRDIMGICAYPLLLLGLSFVMMFFLLIGFIPQIADLFEGKSLHPISLFVMNMSGWLLQNMGLFFSGLTVLMGSVFFLVKNKKTSIIIKNFFLKFSLFKKMAKNYHMARFTRLLHVLLSEDISLLKTLCLVTHSFKGSLFSSAIKGVEKKILLGKSFSQALSEDQAFDRVFVQMAKIGEEAGNLKDITQKAFFVYDVELKRSFSQFKKLLGPALLFLLALIIGLVLLATLLPLTDVTNII